MTWKMLFLEQISRSATIDRRTIGCVCMQNLEGISLLVTEIQQFNFTCRKQGQMKVSGKVIVNTSQREYCNTPIEYDLVARNLFM